MPTPDWSIDSTRCYDDWSFAENTELFSVDVDIGPAIGFPTVGSDTMSTEPELHEISAQLDTGAHVSCTDQLHMLHNYVEFSDKNPCPIKLMPATHKSDTTPKGYGYLHVPAQNESGFLAVRTFYTPALRTTVIDERDFILAANLSPKDIESEIIKKYYEAGNFSYIATHKLKQSLNVRVNGSLRNGKRFSFPLIPPCTEASVKALLVEDDDFRLACEQATLCHIFAHQEQEYAKLREDLKQLPMLYQDLPYHEYIHHNTPVNAIREETQRMLWHQRLGHPSDYYLFNAHKHITGVPQFKHLDPILETCPTCIRAKQTKEPAGPHSTRTATRPYQGLSIDFSFAGQKSKNNERASDFVGLNGETCWILVSDHFSRMKHGSTRVSKASPLQWLQDFLTKYSPNCSDKYVFLDQGGELYGNPAVRQIFADSGYTIRPTGADASNQNGPVERGHLTVANAIRAMLTGANLPIKFWPYAFHHWLRIDNSLPSRDQEHAPLKLAHNKTDDFTNFRTFGCRVWVRPPGQRKAKLLPNSRKGIFLGYLPDTTSNILWYDPETSRVKIAKHARFDEGMNDLPITDVPPNVVHLQRTQIGEPIPADELELDGSPFDADPSPFFRTIDKTVTVSCQRNTFGFSLQTDDLSGRVFVSDIKQNSSASRLFSSHKSTNNKLRGAYIVSIDDDPVFSQDDALRIFMRLREQHA